MCVVPTFDEVEDSHPGLGLSAEASSIEQLSLERGKEALAHRVVVVIGYRFHGGPNSRFLAAKAEGNRSVLAP